MNSWNKFSDSFKYILILGFSATVFNVINDSFLGIDPEINLAIFLVKTIAFVILANHDAMVKRSTGQIKVASGWWAVLGIAYPIAVLYVERNWSYVCWYMASTLGTLFVLVGIFATFGLI